MALRELTVENLAVVESVRLVLAPGFPVLTGETGAGKSLVVDAVALALGARASADQVRSGADAARVEAIFDAPVPVDDDPEQTDGSLAEFVRCVRTGEPSTTAADSNVQSLAMVEAAVRSATDKRRVTLAEVVGDISSSTS